MMFTVSHDPLDLEALKSELPDPGAGACVIFEGWIRDTNYDKPVTALDYEVYEEMAVKEGNRVMAEAMEEYDILAARCAHVAGHLEVGDCAVWVGVSSAHRDAAFRACRFIIDEIKKRLPIWKKEFFQDGDTGWVNCEHGSESAAPDSVAEHTRSED